VSLQEPLTLRHPLPEALGPAARLDEDDFIAPLERVERLGGVAREEGPVVRMRVQPPEP
jgi:hypothetical protein